jgi:hypothetical protein
MTLFVEVFVLNVALHYAARLRDRTLRVIGVRTVTIRDFLTKRAAALTSP